MQYDYRCPDCNEVLTIERSIHEEPRNPSCFVCHITMVRKWDSPGITFKGKGFYSTGGQCYDQITRQQVAIECQQEAPASYGEGFLFAKEKGQETLARLV